MRNFKFFFITFFVFLLFFGGKLNAEVVNKVNVKGNKRISLETIIIFADIEIEKNYETSDINLMIKKLYETNYFSKKECANPFRLFFL